MNLPNTSVMVDRMRNLNFSASNGSTESNNGTVSADHVAYILGWVTFALGLPSICLALYSLVQLMRAGKAAPVYVISLLASDVFNLVARPQISVESSIETSAKDVPTLIFYFGVASNVVFLVCVAQERHLLVALPQCNGCCSRIKQSALISAAAWAAPVGVVLLAYYGHSLWFSVSLLLPFPLLCFFCLDSWRASCCMASMGVTGAKRILGMQVLLLLNYCVLYLPFAVKTLLDSLSLRIYSVYLGLVADSLLYLGPLVDPLLSVLVTKRARDLLEVFPCCKTSVHQGETPTVVTVSEIVTRL